MKLQPKQRSTRVSSKDKLAIPTEKKATKEFTTSITLVPDNSDKKISDGLYSFNMEIITVAILEHKLKPIQTELEKLIRTYNSLKFTLGDINSSLRQVNIQLSQIEGQTKPKQSWFKKIFSKKP